MNGLTFFIIALLISQNVLSILILMILIRSKGDDKLMKLIQAIIILIIMAPAMAEEEPVFDMDEGTPAPLPLIDLPVATAVMDGWIEECALREKFAAFLADDSLNFTQNNSTEFRNGSY